MARIDELIQQLCSDGVEYKPLREVAKIVGGRDYKHLGTGDVPVYGSGGIMASVDTAAYCGPSVLLPRKGSISNVFYVEGPFWNVDTVFYTEIDFNQILPRFLFQVILSKHIEDLNTSSAARPALTRKVLDAISIPVPALEVQQEIVRILDAFTELEANLQRELDARKRQCAHYREKLLSFGDGIELVPLGDLSEKPMYGASFSAVEGDQSTDYRYIRITDITPSGELGDDWKTADQFNDKYVLEDNDLLFARTGATVGKTLLYREQMGKSIFAGYLIRFRFNISRVLPEYVSQCVNTARYWEWVESSKGVGAQPNIGAKTYAGFSIPVPPLVIQQQIVDKLDAMVALQDNLQRQIELTHKQYEHYRDQLLDLPRKVA